jgi:hypothetical protein
LQNSRAKYRAPAFSAAPQFSPVLFPFFPLTQPFCFAAQEYAYDTLEVAVDLCDTSVSPRIVSALAFKTSSCAVAPCQTLPSHRYMGIIRQGAREAALSGSYCSWLDRVPTERP